VNIQYFHVNESLNFVLIGYSWRGHLCDDLQEMSNWSPTKTGFNPRHSGNVGVVTVSFDASECV
jgi:hypothetical protein